MVEKVKIRTRTKRKTGLETSSNSIYYDAGKRVVWIKQPFAALLYLGICDTIILGPATIKNPCDTIKFCVDPDVNTSCVPTFKAYRVEFATHNIFEYAQIGKAVPPEFELKCVHSLVIDKKLFKTVGAKQIKNKFEPCKTCQSVDEINQKSQILKFEKGRTA